MKKNWIITLGILMIMHFGLWSNSLRAADIEAVLDSTGGGSGFVVQDSTLTEKARIDSSGKMFMQGFQLGTSTTAGYVLTTNSSGVGAWAAGGTPDISYFRRTGTTRERWYTVNTTATAMTVSTALTANRIYAHPFLVPKTITLDRMAVNCTTLVASGRLRLGIYTDSNGEPGTLVLDAGEVDTSAIGVKTLTISQQLTGGNLYWLVAASNSATHAFRVPAIASTINIGGLASTLGTGVMTHYYAAFTYAALPATFPTPTEGTTLIYPAIFVRLSL